jgi:ribosome-associated protein
MSTHIPDLEPEITFKTSRSGGKGGQNVNKVSTKVELNFVVADSQLLSEEQKIILLEKLAGRLTKDGMLQIVSQTERSQPGNKRVAIEKFYALLNECLIVRKKRKPTKVPRAVKEKRLLQKKRNAEIKRLRRSND